MLAEVPARFMARSQWSREKPAEVVLAHEHRWRRAWHAEGDGAGRNEKAFGYWENRRNQKCKSDFYYSARRLGKVRDSSCQDSQNIAGCRGGMKNWRSTLTGRASAAEYRSLHL